MFSALIRIGCLIFGGLLVAELALPAKFETATIQRHEFTAASSRAKSLNESDDYKIYLAGSKVGSCQIGANAYNNLKDGEQVRIKASALFGSCFYVVSEHGTIYSIGSTNIALGAGGLFMLLIGFGIIPISSLKESKD